MERFAGADHFVVASLSMWPSESCAATFGSASKLRSALRIGVDGGPSVRSWKAKPIAFEYGPADNYLTVPGVGAAMLRGFRPSTDHRRRQLATLCALACCHNNHHDALSLRKQLQKACTIGARSTAADGAVRCTLGAAGRLYGLSATNGEYRSRVLSLYASSTFCLILSLSLSLSLTLTLTLTQVRQLHLLPDAEW